MIKFMPILILLISSLLFTNCKGKSNLSESTVASEAKDAWNSVGTIPYNLSEPIQTFNLERNLKEISGLTYFPDQNTLMAINDEKGRIFYLNPSTGKIQENINFHKANDYEGIAYLEGLFYVVESNGNISVIDQKSAKKTDSYKTKLNRKNDIEGLTYNPSTSTFLLAAKGKGKIKGKAGKKKAIFNLDPVSKSIADIPYFTVNLEKAANELSTTTGVSLTNYQLIRINKFSPSGIAVHPITNEIYVLSSRGKLLVTFDQKGTMQSLHFLDEKQHAQPEGICFGPDNTMYISNEGRAGKARLLSFACMIE